MLESFCSQTIDYAALVVQWWYKNDLSSNKTIKKDIATAVHSIRILKQKILAAENGSLTLNWLPILYKKVTKLS